MSHPGGVGRRLLAALIVAHRWAGVVFAPIFVVWFASGVVMLFHQMPDLTSDEQQALARPIDPTRVRITPAGLAERGIWSDGSSSLVLRTLGTQPVYELAGPAGRILISAETGERIPPLSAPEGAALVRQLFGPRAAHARTVATLDRPDQWTFSVPPARVGPLHAVALGDEEDTTAYVAARTGRVVMRTTRESRAWAWVGAIPHWWYIRALRAHPALWGSVVVYGSLAGLLTSLAGLVVGVSRLDWSGRYYGGRSRSPYRGWLRWHHWLGLVGGLLACSWAFSGLLSMTPWDWSPGNGPDPDRVAAVRSAGDDPRAFRLAPSAAVDAWSPASVSSLRTTWVLGRPYYTVDGPAGGRLMPADTDRPTRREGFSAAELQAAAVRAMPGLGLRDVSWLTTFDAYYYAAASAPGDLPVLRARFEDPEGTTLYLRASDGELIRQETRRTRVERWLYHGLHSVDLPGLYQRRAAWLTLVLLLLTVGILLSGSSVVVAWRRVRGVR